MRKRFIFSTLFILVILAGTALAIFLAKGYRFSGQTGTVSGTGIISLSSTPDQASVYIDGHLTTATNANINSLLPKSYDVKITKDGFIPWEKKVEVKEGLVTQIKATLFPAIPTVYPLTFNGVENVSPSSDGQSLFYITPENAADASISATVSPNLRKSGLWVWNMNSNPIPFAGGPEPHKIGDLIPGLDYLKATIRWSPDSSQVLVNLADRSLIFSSGSYNSTGQDITATLEPTLRGWDEAEKSKEAGRENLIKDVNLKAEASGSAFLKWSPDETKLLYSKDGKQGFKVADLIENKSYDIAPATFISWLPDSRHLIVVDAQPGAAKDKSGFETANLSISEFDGFNKSEVYYGNFDPNSVFAWPDSSRLVIVSSVATPTANIPNLFGINLK